LRGGLHSIRCVPNGLGLSLGLKWSLPRGSGFCRSRKSLASHLAGNAQSRTKNAANKLSSHTVYDGSSDAGSDASRNIPLGSICALADMAVR
jgi:hypothetical protein